MTPTSDRISEWKSGMEGSEGGGLEGGGWCIVTGSGPSWSSSAVSRSSGSSCCSTKSETSSGIGGRGGLAGRDTAPSSSSANSRMAECAGDGLRTRECRSGKEADALGPARASCGVRTTVAPWPRTPLRGCVRASTGFAKRGSEMRTGREGA